MTNRPIYTRQEILNYLNTGDPYIPLTGLLNKRDMLGRVLDYAIQHNPQDSYALLKNNFGNEFPNFAKGSWNDTGSQETMSNFLHIKMEPLSDIEAAAFVAPYANLPFNPQVRNWTTPIN